MRTSLKSLIETLHNFSPKGCLRILIIGHGGHGKDTVAKLISDATGNSWCSSSRFAASKILFPLVSNQYPDWQAAYADRRNHRLLWFHAIQEQNNRPGPSLIEQMLREHKICVGVRSRDEFLDAKQLFDLVIWVDRSDYVPPEGEDSMELNSSDADIIVDNNVNLGKDL